MHTFQAFKCFFCLVILIPSISIAQPSQGLKFASDAQLAGIPLASTPFSGTELPASVDLTPSMPPPANQGHQNSCVAWAIAYGVKSYQEQVEERISLVKSGGEVNYDRVFSPAYVYNQINQGRDGGSLISDGLNVLSSKGAATWSSMPYSDRDFLTAPTAQQHSDAARYRIDYWRRVNVADSKEIKAQLAAGYPVIIGAIIDDGFINLPRTQIWSAIAGQQHGGHAMVIVGYDDGRAAFKLLNSWGHNWGDNGYGWISYSFVSSVVREGYVAKDAANGVRTIVQPSGPSAPIQFAIANVRQNVPSVGLGMGMLMQGTISLPPGMTGSAQIVVQIYLNNGGVKGPPVGSLIPAHSTIHGMAATGTPTFPIPSTGVMLNWYANMPYSALNVPRGMRFGLYGVVGTPVTSHLIAEPTLFINQFGVKTSGLIPFMLTL